VARLFGCTADQAAAVITELVDMQICESNLDESLLRGLLSGDRKEKVRLESRRMLREENDRKNNALYQERHRSKGKSKGEVREEVRSLSSSSSSYPLISPNGGLRCEDLFEIFWASYPAHRQTGRKSAYSEWRKLKPDREMLDRMLSALDRQKESSDWIKEDGRYVPGIRKWLEDRYWELVVGFPARQMRELLRQSDLRLSAEDVNRVLGLKGEKASQFLENLEHQGYIVKNTDVPGPKLYWKHTISGGALCNALFSAPVSRRNAEKKLAEFMERVHRVNKDSRFLYRVQKVVLFGSFLSESPTVGDLDIAIDLQPKEPDLKKHTKLIRARADEALRASSPPDRASGHILLQA